MKLSDVSQAVRQTTAVTMEDKMSYGAVGGGSRRSSREVQVMSPVYFTSPNYYLNYFLTH